MHKELIDKLCPGCHCETEVIYDTEDNPIGICTKCHMDEDGAILQICDACFEYDVCCTCVKCETCKEPFLFCECKHNNTKAKKKMPHKVEFDMDVGGKIGYKPSNKTEDVNMTFKGEFEYYPPEEKDTDLILV